MNNYTFYIDDYANELKQHLNLSENAWIVIDEDIKNFFDGKEKESFSGFLNRIFSNFYQIADASIYQRRIEKAEELDKLYSSKEFESIDKNSLSLFIDKYLSYYENQLLLKTKSYTNGYGKKFRINKINVDILRESEEAKYYDGSIGLYLKSIFEEYVTKPIYYREQIFFSDCITKINEAITRQKKLKISLIEKTSTSGNKYCRKFYVSPYCIIQDKNKTFNYLIGFSEEIKEIEVNENGNIFKKTIVLDKSISSFRISRINKAEIMVSMGAHISKENIAQFNKMLIDRGPQFMLGDVVDIKVKFSDKGLESFKRQLYMRPQFYDIDSNDNHLYTFHCTEVQAINYFFKFGRDAEIISPISLRDKFCQRYESALKLYK